MAALLDHLRDSVIPLRNVRVEQLSPILEAEVEAWRPLHWDFRQSAELVRRFCGMQALEGYALIASGEIAGFAYSVTEEDKGLVGDLFVLPRFRTVDREHLLLEATLGSMWRMPGLHRVEAQLLMLSDALHRRVPFQSWFQPYARQFFEAPLSRGLQLVAREPMNAVIGPWAESRHDDAARLIAASYKGHVDGLINDQYRSAAGARRFLTNIVQYPGCGTFYPAGSFVAVDRANHTLCGVCLASLVADDAGHITQICVAPAHRGTGLGYELLRRSLVALSARGAKTASLTVTSSNTSAIDLYQRMGFARIREFAAHVWERP